VCEASNHSLQEFWRYQLAHKKLTKERLGCLGEYNNWAIDTESYTVCKIEKKYLCSAGF
jgi:hypothetical protein